MKNRNPAQVLVRLCLGVLLLSTGGAGRGAKPQSADKTAVVALPDTPAGRKMATWIAAFNTGRHDAIRDFLAANYSQASLRRRSAADRADFLVELYQDTGGFDVRRVVESSDLSVIVLAQDRVVGDWTRLHLDLDPQPPHATLSMGIRPEAPPAATGGKLSDAQIAEQLRQYVEKLAAADRFSGAVLVARDGRPLFQGAWGLASRAWNQAKARH